MRTERKLAILRLNREVPKRRLTSEILLLNARNALPIQQLKKTDKRSGCESGSLHYSLTSWAPHFTGWRQEDAHVNTGTVRVRKPLRDP